MPIAATVCYVCFVLVCLCVCVFVCLCLCVCVELNLFNLCLFVLVFGVLRVVLSDMQCVKRRGKAIATPADHVLRVPKLDNGICFFK